MPGGATLYVASVAKTPEGVANARATLSRTARQYRVPALMVNSVGTCEGKLAGGTRQIIDDLATRAAQPLLPLSLAVGGGCGHREGQQHQRSHHATNSRSSSHRRLPGSNFPVWHVR